MQAELQQAAHTFEENTRSWHSSSMRLVAWSYPRSTPWRGGGRQAGRAGRQGSQACTRMLAKMEHPCCTGMHEC